MTPVAGETLNDATVQYNRGIYQMAFDIQVDAAQAEVYRLLTDYDGLGRLNDMVRESRIIDTTDPFDKTRQTLLQFCVLFFCNTVTLVEALHENGSDRITATVIPEQSDVVFGETQLDITSLSNDQSRIQYTSKIQPKFWIPPVIGPWLIRQKMKTELAVMMNRIESLANDQAGHAIQ